MYSNLREPTGNQLNLTGREVELLALFRLMPEHCRKLIMFLAEKMTSLESKETGPRRRPGSLN